MKSYKSILFTLMFVILFLAASCTSDTVTTTEQISDINVIKNTSDDTPADNTAEAPAIEDKPIPLSANIQIDHVSDDLLKNFEMPYEYIVDENGAEVMIWTDIAIKDFTLYETGYDIEDDNFALYPANILYTIDELPPERPFVITMYMPEIIPTHGFSFTDSDNTKRSYLIQESGLDGSLFLGELPLEDAMTKASHSNPGRVEISFNYEKISGSASNQYAIWIEDMSGNLVRTLYATQWTVKGGYKSRPDSIPIWVGKTELSSMDKVAVDAVSGATPKTGPLTYTWDLADSSGNSVVPGEYRVLVEGTLRWKNQVLYSGIIDVSGDLSAIEADADYIYEASERYAALTGDSPENLMIGPVTVTFIPSNEEDPNETSHKR